MSDEEVTGSGGEEDATLEADGFAYKKLGPEVR